MMSQQTPYPAIQRLEALVGEWKMDSPQFPGGRGRARFEWLERGAFLLHRSETGDAAAPDATMIIGGDQSTENFGVLYSDSRGVSRVYQMSLTDGIWKLWREAPGFWQRFEGIFSVDGRAIRGMWESSDDGSRWEHDFDLTYTKLP